MERLHLVGKSRDGTKLYLARSRGATAASMEIPITRKLRALIEEGAEGPPIRERDRLAKRLKEAERRAEAAEARLRRAERRAEEAEARANEAQSVAESGPAPRRGPEGGLAPGGFERATGLRPEDALHGLGALIRAARDETGHRAGPALEDEAPPGEEPGPPSDPRTRKRLNPSPTSELSPAEIQSLLRSGRGVRAVASQAKASIEWVKRLAAPIESERVGVVTQLLQTYLERPRLGRSALPLGAAILENLRRKGVRFPERVVEEGWSAARPEGRHWRIRFTYESRGRKQRADWSFDAQSRTAVADNDLGAELGFRPAEKDGLPDATAGGIAAAIRPTTVAAGRQTGRGSGSRAEGARGAGSSSRSRSTSSSTGRATRGRRKRSTKKKQARRRSGRAGR